MTDFSSPETPSDVLDHVHWAAMRAARDNQVRSMKALDAAAIEIEYLRETIRQMEAAREAAFRLVYPQLWPVTGRTVTNTMTLDESSGGR